jgi:hypothetical protein
MADLGRPKHSEERKINNRERRKRRRKEYLVQLEASGQLTTEGKLQLEKLRKEDRKAQLKEGREERARCLKRNEDNGVDLATYDIPYKGDRFERVKEKSYRHLTQAEKKQVLSHLSVGWGRGMIMRHLKLDNNTFYRTLREDHEFRGQVETLEVARIDDCELVIYSKALDNDVGAAKDYINIRRGMDRSSFDRRMAVREFKLRERVVNAQIGQGQTPHTVDWNPLIESGEFEEYLALYDRVQRGEGLTAEEYARFGMLTAKVSRASLGGGVGDGSGSGVNGNGMAPQGLGTNGVGTPDRPIDVNGEETDVESQI